MCLPIEGMCFVYHTLHEEQSLLTEPQMVLELLSILSKIFFLVDNHYKTIYGPVRSECSFCRVYLVDSKII